MITLWSSQREQWSASSISSEAMVSGRVNADIYKVHNGRVVDKKISAKKLAIYAVKEGGTKELEIEPER